MSEVEEARERRDAAARLSTAATVAGLLGLLVGVPLLLLYRWWWAPLLPGLLAMVLGTAGRGEERPSGTHRGISAAGAMLGGICVVVGLFGLLGNGLGG